ncbi:hypothetical protein [Kytococcus aerolatus]|uniref:hypothetical protein n=1 Tax=Kytococcus aerolatus TaxID=592308 RepID=UPI000B592263|nr:hypothetical protein [Kytococcus aerolatus]
MDTPTVISALTPLASVGIALTSGVMRRRPWAPEHLEDIAADLARELERISLCPLAAHLTHRERRVHQVEEQAVSRWLYADLFSRGEEPGRRLAAAIQWAGISIACSVIGLSIAVAMQAPASRILMAAAFIAVSFSALNWTVGTYQLLRAGCDASRRAAYRSSLESLLERYGYGPHGESIRPE